MKLVRLKVNNFMSIGNIDLPLDRVGMNLVLGKNLDDSRFDSNGSAKSALFEAMTWGLFGEFLRELTSESVIRLGQDKVTVSVLVDPEDGSERVWFVRTRSKKEHKMDVRTESGVQLFPANSVKDIQPQINSWLGLDFRTFTNSVYFGKGLVKFFMASNDTERKELLETILQLVSFDDALDRAKGLSKKCTEDIAEHNTNIAISKALNVEKNATLSGLIENILIAKKKKEEEQPKLLDKRSRLSIDKQKIADSLSRLDTLINKEKKDYDDTYNKINAEHVKEISELDKVLAASINYTEDLFEKDILKLKEDSASALQKIQEEYDKLDATKKRIVDAKLDFEKEISKTKGIIHSIEKERTRVRNLTEDLPCKECHQNISIEHKSALINKYTEEIQPLTDHIVSLEKQISDLSSDLKSQYDKPYQSLKDYHTKTVEVNETLLDAKQNDKRCAIDELQNKNTKEMMKLSQKFINETKALQEEHHKKINQWVTEKADRQVAINNIETEINNITKISDDLDSTYERLHTQIEDAKKDIDRVIKQQKFSEEKIDAIQAIKSKTDFWIEGFGPRGIKSFVFEAALPYLTARTNHYSSFLTGGTVTIDITPLSVVKSTGNVKEKMNVSAVNSHGANVYNGNSDGERRRIDICVLLALQDLISTRASKTWNTLIFDEIFDALDKTGIEHVVDMFRTFKDKSIYIISHSEDIKKHFDTAIIVQKKDGISSIKEIV